MGSAHEVKPVESSGGTPPTDDGRPVSGREMLAAAAVVVLAAALRLVNLSASSLTIDEVNDHLLVSGPFARSLSSGNGFPPGYSLAIQSVDWLLPSAQSQRYLSVLCGVLVVILGGVAGYSWLGRRATIPTMLVLALSPALVYLSREARPYALEHLFAAVVVIGVSPKVRNRSYWPAAVGISGVLLATNSSFAYVSVAALIVLLSARAAGELKRLLWPSVCVVASFVAVVATIGPDLSVQRRLSGEYPAALNDGITGLRRFVHASSSIVMGFSAYGSPHKRTTQTQRELFVEAFPYLLALGFVVAVVVVVAVRKWRATGTLASRSSTELWSLALAPFVAFVLLSLLLDFDFRGRYFGLCVLPLAVLLVGWLPSLTVGLRRAVIAVLLVLACVSNYQRIFSDEFANTDYQALAERMGSIDPGSPVYLIPGVTMSQVGEYDRSLSWLEETGVHGPYTVVELARLKSWVAEQTVDPDDCSFLVLADLGLIDPDRSFAQFLESQGVTLTKVFESVGVEMYEMCGLTLPGRQSL